MKFNAFFAIVGVFVINTFAAAALYTGNGNGGFGGAVGQGSLTLTTDGTTVFGSITKGPGQFNDTLVIYLDSTPGGFATTLGFADANDGLRRSISGFDGGVNRSLMTFLPGFSPDYALALGPGNESFGGLWQLANGGNNSLNFVTAVGLNNGNNNPTYNFSFTLAQIGLTPNVISSFDLFGTYISNTGFRSSEALPGNDIGVQGWNPYVQTAAVTFVVPEPATSALLGMAGLFATRVRRRK